MEARMVRCCSGWDIGKCILRTDSLYSPSTGFSIIHLQSQTVKALIDAS